VCTGRSVVVVGTGFTLVSSNGDRLLSSLMTSPLVLPFCEDLGLSEDVELLLVDLNLCSAVLGQKHLVAGSNKGFDVFSLGGPSTLPNCNDGGSLDFVLGLLGKKNTTFGLYLGHHPLYENAVKERNECTKCHYV